MKRNPKHGQAGFSLLELLIVVGILSIVMAIAGSAATQMMQTNANTTDRVDLMQEARQFMDQITNDIRNAGYPPQRMYDSSALPSSYMYAAGLTTVSSNQLVFEGDVDGSGQVSIVYIQLSVPTGGCPCTLQRGFVPKQTGGTPIYYTELDGVLNTDVFYAYFYDGTTVSLPASSTDMPNIKTIQAKVNLRSTTGKVGSNYPAITLTTEGKISSN